MECRRIIGDRHTYWNIKGWGHFVVFFYANCLSFRLLAEGRLGTNCGTTSVPLQKGKHFMAKTSDFAQLSIPFRRTAGKSSSCCQRTWLPFRASIPHRRL